MGIEQGAHSDRPHATVQILGREFALKTMGCNVGHSRGKPIPPVVSLYVKVTDACNARCPFCSNAALIRKDAQASAAEDFDINAFFDVVDAILDHEHLHLGSIRFTGGEPSVVADSVMLPVLNRLDEDQYRHIYLHLNTNALLPQATALLQHPRWNSISVSLHHYDRTRLAEIYGTRVPDEFMLTPFRREGLKINVSCNLIRGYIDNAEEAQRMMEHALDIGADTLGFVSLMPVNKYCREHYVDYKEILWDQIPTLYFSHRMDRGETCRCADYLYNSAGRPLQVYMRSNLDPSYCESALTFSGRTLRQGF